MSTPMYLQIARVVALLAFGLFGVAAVGQEAKDMRLEDMGFVMRPANTPEQLARLRRLPPRIFLGRTKNGARYYIYADPDYCQCVFLGDALAMRNYRNLVAPPPQAPMAIGSGDSLLLNGVIEEIDPALGMTIEEGDILDYP
jgi:hypothetical protein